MRVVLERGHGGTAYGGEWWVLRLIASSRTLGEYMGLADVVWRGGAWGGGGLLVVMMLFIVVVIVTY
jgi:hypothetical protein